MPVRNKYAPKVLIALSPNTICNALEYIHPEVIRGALDSGELPSYRIGVKTRVLVSDLENWIRSKPQPNKKRDPKTRGDRSMTRLTEEDCPDHNADIDKALRQFERQQRAEDARRSRKELLERLENGDDDAIQDT
jgi:hypothetical protein